MKTIPIPIKFDRQGHPCNFHAGLGPTESLMHTGCPNSSLLSGDQNEYGVQGLTPNIAIAAVRSMAQYRFVASACFAKLFLLSRKPGRLFARRAAAYALQIDRATTAHLWCNTSVHRTNSLEIRLACLLPSQRSLHKEPIFRLILKVAVNGTHEYPFCGSAHRLSLTAIPRRMHRISSDLRR